LPVSEKKAGKKIKPKPKSPKTRKLGYKEKRELTDLPQKIDLLEADQKHGKSPVWLKWSKKSKPHTFAGKSLNVLRRAPQGQPHSCINNTMRLV